MKVLFVHQRWGDLGGAESTIRRLGEGLGARGVKLGFLHGEVTDKGHERFLELFERRWSWSEGQLGAALAWQADVLFVHKLDELPVLERLVQSGARLVRMVHDHDIYCQRRHRYLPWNRQICTRPAGWMCGALCGVVKTGSAGGASGMAPAGNASRSDSTVRLGDGTRRRLPIALAWPGSKLREIELCKRFHHLITVSDYLKGELVLNGFDPARITTLWPAVRDVAPSYQPTYREPRVVFAGQLLRGKGVDVLLEALPLLRTPGWRCSIVGEGSYRERAEGLVDALGLRDRVRLEGWIPQRELEGILRDARAGVVPSVWPEPLGAVGIEMLRHGLPVVGFDVGGIPEWLRDGVNGYLVPVFDRPGLARALDRLLGDPELAARLGGEGRRLAQLWCREEEHFEALLRCLTGDPEPSRPGRSARVLTPTT